VLVADERRARLKADILAKVVGLDVSKRWKGRGRSWRCNCLAAATPPLATAATAGPTAAAPVAATEVGDGLSSSSSAAQVSAASKVYFREAQGVLKGVN